MAAVPHFTAIDSPCAVLAPIFTLDRQPVAFRCPLAQSASTPSASNGDHQRLHVCWATSARAHPRFRRRVCHLSDVVKASVGSVGERGVEQCGVCGEAVFEGAGVWVYGTKVIPRAAEKVRTVSSSRSRCEGSMRIWRSWQPWRQLRCKRAMMASTQASTEERDSTRWRKNMGEEVKSS